MRLMTLAGRYAGQVRDYSTAVGLAALRSGTAARVGELGPVRPVPVATAVSSLSPVSAAPAPQGKRKK